MKTYKVSNRISEQAKKEIERILDTHDRYKKAYFFKPDSTANGRRRNERMFAKNNPDVSFIKNGSLIKVSMSYSESCKNVYYSISITQDDFYKEESASNPIAKNITTIKKLIR